MLEARDQFVAGDGRSSEFTDNHGAGVVRDLGRLEWRGVACERKGEHSNGSIARARDVEHILRFGWDVVRMLAFFEEHHPLFTQGHQKMLERPFSHQLLSSTDQSDSLLWWEIIVTVRNARSPEGFRPVWLDRGNAAPVDQVSRVRIGGNNLLGGSAVASDLGNQLSAQKSFAVVFKDNRVEIFHSLP